MSEVPIAADGDHGFHVVAVEPFGDGWAVHCPGVANPLLFRSGARAERAARRLGESLASVGQWAEVRVTLRDGRFGGRFVYPPCLNALDRAAGAGRISKRAPGPLLGFASLKTVKPNC